MIDTEVIMELWNRFTAFLSGWPKGKKEVKKIKEEAAKEKNKPKAKPKKNLENLEITPWKRSGKNLRKDPPPCLDFVGLFF